MIKVKTSALLGGKFKTKKIEFLIYENSLAVVFYRPKKARFHHKHFTEFHKADSNKNVGIFCYKKFYYKKGRPSITVNDTVLWQNCYLNCLLQVVVVKKNVDCMRSFITIFLKED